MGLRRRSSRIDSDQVNGPSDRCPQQTEKNQTLGQSDYHISDISQSLDICDPGARVTCALNSWNDMGTGPPRSKSVGWAVQGKQVQSPRPVRQALQHVSQRNGFV